MSPSDRRFKISEQLYSIKNMENLIVEPKDSKIKIKRKVSRKSGRKEKLKVKNYIKYEKPKSRRGKRSPKQYHTPHRPRCMGNRKIVLK